MGKPKKTASTSTGAASVSATGTTNPPLVDPDSFLFQANRAYSELTLLRDLIIEVSPLDIENHLNSVMDSWSSIEQLPVSEEEKELHMKFFKEYCELKKVNNKMLTWVKRARDKGMADAQQNLHNFNQQPAVLPLQLESPKYDGQLNNFDAHKEKFDLFIQAAGISNMDQIKSLFLSSLDIPVFKTITRLVAPATLQDITLEEIIVILRKRYEIVESYHITSFKFQALKQQSGQCISDFVSILQEKAVDAKYVDAERRIVEQLIKGVNDDKLRDKLTAVRDIKLEQALEISYGHESSQRSKSSFSELYRSQNTDNIYKLNEYKQNFKPRLNSGNDSSSQQVQYKSPTDQQKDAGYKNDSSYICFRCGADNHRKSHCPYSDFVKCSLCGLNGHLKAVCRKNKAELSQKKPESAAKSDVNQSSTSKESTEINKKAELHALEETPDTHVSMSSVSSDEVDPEFSLPFYNISTNESCENPYSCKLKVNGSAITFQMDTGCAKSIISSECYNKHFSSTTLHESNVTLKTWDSNSMSIAGFILVNVSHNGLCYELPLYVLNGNGPPLLGRDWISALRVSISPVINAPVRQPEESNRMAPDLWIKGMNRHSLGLKEESPSRLHGDKRRIYPKENNYDSSTKPSSFPPKEFFENNFKLHFKRNVSYKK